MKFKVLHGAHREGGCTYYRNEVVDSKIDLAKRFNTLGTVKFEPTDGPATKKVPKKAQPVEQSAPKAQK